MYVPSRQVGPGALAKVLVFDSGGAVRGRRQSRLFSTSGLNAGLFIRRDDEVVPAQRSAVVDIADLLKKLDEANNVVQGYEGSRCHEPRLKQFGDRLDRPLANLIRDGLKIPEGRYNEAKRCIAESRVRFTEIFRSTPVILAPAAPGPAPLGLSTTGDRRMNAPWTALGTPAVSIPMPVASGLPLGLQLTADLGQDSRVLLAAFVASAFQRRTQNIGGLTPLLFETRWEGNDYQQPMHDRQDCRGGTNTACSSAQARLVGRHGL